MAKSKEKAIKARRKEREYVDQPGEVEIPHDPVNEQVVICAAVIDEDTRNELVIKLSAEHFIAPEHKVIWEALCELVRRKLAYDPATIQELSGGTVDTEYIESLVSMRPELPDNLDFHVDRILWGHARVTVAVGPTREFLLALKDPTSDPERVKALSRQIPMALDGYEDRRYLLDPDALRHRQIADIRERMKGRGSFPYGIKGFDADQETGIIRLIPGSFPGGITTITGVSGSGKTTTAARIALGIIAPKENRRKVLYGAWEVESGMTLEIMSCMSLASEGNNEFSRSRLLTGKITEDELSILEQRMEVIGRHVQFLANPFRRQKTGKERPSNERNLDIVQGYIADSGCEVFIADLWKRCLADTDPKEEELALWRQQAMVEEMKVHAILCQQQKLKEVEATRDKRPRRDTIIGSSAWVDVSDTIIGVHRPALWKNVSDTTIELLILKQRFGKWPIAIECDWDGDKGLIMNGREIPFERAPDNDTDDAFAAPKKDKGDWKGKGKRSA